MTPRPPRPRLHRSCWPPPTASTAAGWRGSSASTTAGRRRRTGSSDGVDFVPTRPFYLFAQHFSAIAAAGPIAGPILACQAFGWLPCLLWIGLGVVLIGAVHDFSSLTASVRHGAHLDRRDRPRAPRPARAGLAMMAFIWIALIYVIVAFADITAAQLRGGHRGAAAGALGFHPGGAVAAASVLYLRSWPVLMGSCSASCKPPLWLVTVIFVPATFALPGLGTKLSHALVFDRRGPGPCSILVYCVRRLGGAGLGAAPAARLPRRLRALRGAGARRDRRLLRRLRGPAAGLQAAGTRAA